MKRYLVAISIMIAILLPLTVSATMWSELDSLTTVATGDYFAIVDVSATPDMQKKVTWGALMGAPGAIGGTTPPLITADNVTVGAAGADQGDLNMHHGGVLTMFDAGNDYSVTLQVTDGTTKLHLVGNLDVSADVIVGSDCSPDSADGATLGRADDEWSDLYLADGSIIYGQNDQSNTMTSSAAGWTFGLFPMTPSAAPDADYEVANKKYVDDTVAGGFDSTAVDATTWSDNANASNVWTFDVSGTDHTMTAGNGLMTFSHAVTVSGTITGNLTGNVTGDVSGSSGSCTGNSATATLASTVTVSDDESTDDAHELVFTTDNSSLESDGTATYNPSTGVITTTGFAGALTGNVTGDVSGSSGSCTGNAATATTASAVTVSDDESTDDAHELVFTTDNSNLESDGTATYNPSTGVITATGFAGALTGNVTGDVSGSSGSCTGTAALATTVTVSDDESTDDAHEITFTTDNSNLESDGDFTYNPSTGTVSCTVISPSTDLTVANGGTGASTLTDGGVLLGSGTDPITAMAVLADGEMIVGDGTTDPVAESGATLRTSIGVGTGDSPQFTGVELSHASANTLTGSSGNALIEGIQLARLDQVFTMGKTVTELGNADATPDVSAAATGGNNFYYTNENGTITDFDDGDDHSEFSNGDWFVLRVDDASTTIDFSENANIEGNAGVDFTGSATQITYLMFIYEDSRWNCVNLQTGMSTPTNLALSSLTMGGVILGDSSPDAAGELGYDSTQLSVHDGTASRSVLQVASTTITKSEYLPIRYAEDDDSVTAPAAVAEVGSTTAVARSFVEDADNGVVFWWNVPIDYSAGIKYRVYYAIETDADADETVAFSMSGCSVGNTDAIACSEGSAVVVTDELTTDYDANEMIISDWSAAVTVTNIAAGEMAKLLFIRDISGDDYEGADDNVLVIAVEIKYQAKVNASGDY